MQALLNEQKKKFVDTYSFLMLFSKQINYDMSSGNWSKNLSWNKYFITINLTIVKNNNIFNIDLDDDYLLFTSFNKKFFTLNVADYIKLLLSKNKILYDEKTNQQITSIPNDITPLLSNSDFIILKNAI
jgi:hypothetical protein